MASPQLPLEIWFQIIHQTLNLLLPTATTPRFYATYILPLLLTSHTFHDQCHPVTHPHLRKHRLLQLFTRWKAAHSREVHFYHHPLRNRVRYALPDRVGNPPGEEYETLYSFIKRAYLFGCESVCGTVIPVEGGLEGTALAPVAAAGANGQGDQNEQVSNGEAGGAANAAAANAAAAATSAPGSTAGVGVAPTNGQIILAPPPAPAAAPVANVRATDGGGQGWKGHSLQWHVANPTFAAEGTLELYKDIVEEYRRVVCGTPPSGERMREIERAIDMMKNPHRYPNLPAIPPFEEEPREQRSEDMGQDEGDNEADDENEEEEDEEEDEEEEDEEAMANQSVDELLCEIEAKGGLRRRDSGHGQSSSEMDIDDDDDEDEAEQSQRMEIQPRDLDTPTDEGRVRTGKREPDAMAMDYQIEGAARQRRGPQSRKLERSISASEQERQIMDMALDKPYHAMTSLSPFHPLESMTSSPPSSSSSSSSSSLARSASPAPLTPLTPSLRKSRENGSFTRSKTSSRSTIQRSHSNPGPPSKARSSSRTTLRTPNSTQESSLTHSATPSSMEATLLHPLASNTTPLNANPAVSSPLKAEDVGFDLASACANTFASDLAFVLARVPGLGAHFHRFEQLAKLKLHVGWAKHAQSRGGNDVFVMSCSRLIDMLAPLANTPLVSERGG